MPSKVPALIMDVLGLDLSSFMSKLWVQELEWCWAMWRSTGEMSQAKDGNSEGVARTKQKQNQKQTLRHTLCLQFAMQI